jgi:hypothetical protein
LEKEQKPMSKPAVLVAMPDHSVYTLSSLLSTKNAKLEKTNLAKARYYVTGLSLAPANTSGFEVCKGRSKGCTKACLFYAGQGRFANVQRARVAKTRLWFLHPDAFKSLLIADIRKAQATAKNRRAKLAIRLNVLSDMQWETLFPELFTMFPDVQFYDYTKIAGRQTPANYHLTYSRSEANEVDAKRELAAGRNVTVVFATDDLPRKWNGVPVVSGDTHDLRFLDKAGRVVGLYAKGRARFDRSGFVVATA